MKLSFRSPDAAETESRADMLSNCGDERRLVRWYLRHEPHTLLHIGHLVRFVERHGIVADGDHILSVGIDFCKEYYLAELTGAHLHVVDKDTLVVESVAAIAAATRLPLYYYDGDVTASETVERLRQLQCSVLLLSQVDYILSDKAIQDMICALGQSKHMDRIIVLSPSLLRFTGAGVLCTIREIIRLVESVIVLVRARYRISGAFHHTYRRTVALLSRLIGSDWSLSHVEAYAYPSGKMHILLYERRRAGIRTRSEAPRAANL